MKKIFCDNCQKETKDPRGSKSFGVSPPTNPQNFTKFLLEVRAFNHNSTALAELCPTCIGQIVYDMVAEKGRP